MNSDLKFEPRNVVLRDNRNLEYFDNGINSDSALLLHHGTPGMGVVWQTWLDYANKLGVRAISYTRAGYGASARKEGRTVVEVNQDFEELHLQLQVTSFVSIGWSGGGAYALASLLIPQSKGAELVAGVAPYAEMGDRFFEGSPPESREETLKVVESIESAIEVSKPFLEELPTFTPEFFEERAKSRAKYSQFADLYAQFNIHTRAAFLGGMEGLIGVSEDGHMIHRPWGFSVSDISKPVGIWQGEMDTAVTPTMGRYLYSQLSQSELHLFKDQNHSSPMVECRAAIVEAAILKLTA